MWVEYLDRNGDVGYYIAEAEDVNEKLVEYPSKEFLEKEIQNNYRDIEECCRYHQKLHEVLIELNKRSCDVEVGP